MASSRLAIPAIGAASILGAVTYFRSGADPAAESSGQQAARARKKRDQEGLGGAGIGGNAMSGGHEGGMPGSGMQRGTGDTERRVETTATSRDQLPSGGVGGGEGGGRSNARAIELINKKSSSPDWKGDRESSSNESSTNNTQSSSADSLPGRAGASNPRHNNDSNSEHSLGYPPSTSYPGKDSAKELSTPAVAQSGSVSQKLSGIFGQGGPRSQDAEDAKGLRQTVVASNHPETPTKRHSG